MPLVEPIVMGPLRFEDSTATSLSDPSRIEEFDVQMLWKEALAGWDVNLNDCTDGGDSPLKRIVAWLALTFYRLLAIGQKYQLKLSVMNGEIIINPADNINGQTQTLVRLNWKW